MTIDVVEWRLHVPIIQKQTGLSCWLYAACLFGFGHFLLVLTRFSRRVHKTVVSVWCSLKIWTLGSAAGSVNRGLAVASLPLR